MCYVKAKVMPVMKGATGTISQSFRKYESNTLRNHRINELQKTAILRAAHTYFGKQVQVQVQVKKYSTWEVTLHVTWIVTIQGGADESLARPGWKQATTTKLGIYSPYSPRRSIHFLARCSNFCKPIKKIRMLCVQPVLRGSNDPWFGRKMATFQLFFQSREQVVVRRCQIRRIGCVIETLEAQVGQFLLGCKCLVSRGIVVQEQEPLGDLPLRFSFKMSVNCNTRDE